MTGNSEHFCLRWNDFESNISQAFREIRDEKDFFDVTLACEDDQVQAHKVILSACSPFFRTILRRNRHDHPLLYLKGVKYAEIISILNFMYHGEVNVAQEELNSFLAVAEELRVKGLTQNTQERSKQEHTEQKAKMPTPRRAREPPDMPMTSPPVKKARVPTMSQLSEPSPAVVSAPVKTEPISAPDVMEESYQETPTASQGSKHDMVSFEDPNSYDYSGYEEEDPSTAQFDASNSHALRPEGNKDHLETSILQYMEKLPTEDGRTLWQCTLCCKVHHLKHVISDHVEALHLSDIEFECPYCQKKKKSRSNLRAHISTYHREEHQMSKHSDFL